MITRIAKVKASKDIIAGRDLAGIFEDGHVYSVTKIMGEIIVKDLGEPALMNNHEGQRITNVILDGSHCLTQEEKRKYNES